MTVRPRRSNVDCQQAVELVTDYLEGALTRSQRARFERHLRGCPHCTEYLDQMRTTIRVLGGIDAGALAPHVKTDLVALYRRWSAG